MGRQAGQVMERQSTPVVSVASQAVSPWVPVTPHMKDPSLDTVSPVMDTLLCLAASQKLPAFFVMVLSPTVRSDIFLSVESIMAAVVLVAPLQDDPELWPDSDTADTAGGAAGPARSPVFCRGKWELAPGPPPRGKMWVHLRLLEVSFTRALLGSKGLTRARPGLISQEVVMDEPAPALPHMGLSVRLELTCNEDRDCHYTSLSC